MGGNVFMTASVAVSQNTAQARVFTRAAGGREAYVLGQRIALWEVVDVHQEAKICAAQGF